MAKDEMNAVNLLKSQHREVEKLFKEIESAEEPEDKQALFDDLADKLAIHAKIEEQFFYPAVEENKTEDMILEAFVEHTSVKRLLADLLEVDAGEPAFDAQIKVLKEQVEHHVKEEEGELFPAATKLLSKEELTAIAQEMQAVVSELEDAEPRHDIPEELAAQQQPQG
jgi:hemerythrin-like domain-containing protein